MTDRIAAERLRDALTYDTDPLVDVNAAPPVQFGVATGHLTTEAIPTVRHRVRALALDRATNTLAARWLCGGTAISPLLDEGRLGELDLPDCQRCQIRHYPGGAPLSRYDHLTPNPATAVHEAIERHLHELGRGWRLHHGEGGYTLQHRERPEGKTTTEWTDKGGPYASLREFARSVGIVDDAGKLTDA